MYRFIIVSDVEAPDYGQAYEAFCLRMKCQVWETKERALLAHKVYEPGEEPAPVSKFFADIFAKLKPR